MNIIIRIIRIYGLLFVKPNPVYCWLAVFMSLAWFVKQRKKKGSQERMHMMRCVRARANTIISAPRLGF